MTGADYVPEILTGLCVLAFVSIFLQQSAAFREDLGRLIRPVDLVLHSHDLGSGFSVLNSRSWLFCYRATGVGS
jgi:hypothetical protein